MDKAQEKIAIFMADEKYWNKFSDAMKEYYIKWAGEILSLLGEVGYRKLPKGKPQLLSDEEIREVVGDFILSKSYGNLLQDLRDCNQAQRESDIKYYEG